jgi:uncharacterized SAM-binding protein YcdF (DUF218 family)
MTYLHPVIPALLVLAFAGALYGNRKGGQRTTLLALLGLFLWAWPPIAWLTAASLELRYPLREFPTGDADAIVVLSSGVRQAHPSMPEETADWETYVRCRYAAWLYHHWRAVPVVASGGAAPRAVAADVMRQVLEKEGVPPEKILTEGRSHSTYENAAFTAALLMPAGTRRIALVTEAFHMPRAEAAFRKQGFAVAAAPCAYRQLEFPSWPVWLLPGTGSLRQNDEALHEWIGLAWYCLSGKIPHA